MKLIYGKRIYEMIRLNWIIVLMLLALITVSMVLTGNIFKKQQESKKIVDDFEQNYGDKNYYWLNEGLDDFAYTSYMSGDLNGKLYEKMHALVQAMWNANEYDYYTCCDQPIYIKGIMEDIFLTGYEEGDTEYAIVKNEDQTLSSAKALLVSNKFFECNNVKIKSGRGFNMADYEYEEGKIIPVLLGSEYEKKYKLGDRVEADYFGDITLEVVGFIDSHTFYLSSINNNFVSLERYILLPAWDMDMRSEFSKYVTLLELNGNIQSKLGDNATRAEIENVFNMQNPMWDFNLKNPEENGRAFVVSKYSSMTKQVEKQFNVMVSIVVTFTIVSLMLNIFSILEKNKYNYGIELLCGASLRDVYFEGFGLVFVIVILGDILATIILFSMNCGIRGIILIQLFILVISVIMAISCFIYIKKMRFGEIVGGKE